MQEHKSPRNHAPSIFSPLCPVCRPPLFFLQTPWCRTLTDIISLQASPISVCNILSLSALRLVFMSFSRPSQLPTPPETDTDILAGGHHAIDLMNAPGLHVADPDINLHASMGAPFRRVSTLAYHSSPLRDPRERPNGRQSRWLIVVIPPISLVQDHGPLGPTLTSGPSQRLSQGILMPLQPTVRRHVLHLRFA